MSENRRKEREVIEEKIKNAKLALRPEIYEASISLFREGDNFNQTEPVTSSAEKPGLLNRSLETVRKILDS